MNKHKQKGFTLVELVIVITILGILSAIAFLSLGSYTKNARDSNRLASLSLIDKGLQTNFIKTNSFPKPENFSTVSGSGVGTEISFLGQFGENNARLLNFDSSPQDPSDKEYYIYATNYKQNSYQLLTYLEEKNYSLINQANADSKINRGIRTIGGGVGILLNPTTNEVISSDIQLSNTNSEDNFKIIIPSLNKEILLRGKEIYGALENLNNKAGKFESPKSCPEGFIPVPGNPDFLQPSFCVAKYEMTYVNGGIPHGINTNNSAFEWNSYSKFDNPSCTYLNGGSNCTTDDFKNHKGGIASKPGYPIAGYTQEEAITACKSIGGHLITNNEWMTIARNIENNYSNWLDGNVGGILKNGVSGVYWSPAGCDSSFEGRNGHPSTDNSCSSRVLKLNNGEEIWDISGNLLEHVNKNNTINGDGYSDGVEYIDSNNGVYEGGWLSWNSSTIFENKRNLIGPSNKDYGADNIMGNIYWDSSASSNSIFLRGGAAVHGTYAGIYGLFVAGENFSHDGYLGFRCAF